jgi:ATP-binding cassette subfamily B (MDR/TAP) protein 1
MIKCEIEQTSFPQASKGRTTLIVAHRLSTVRSADRIVVLGEGCVLEQGTHDQLMSSRGVYYDLVSTQTKYQLDVEVSEGKKN